MRRMVKHIVDWWDPVFEGVKRTNVAVLDHIQYQNAAP